jgi:hypothetical protein
MIMLAFEDETGEAYEAKISTMDAATLMFALEGLIQQAVQHPQARQPFGQKLTVIVMMGSHSWKEGK